MTRQGGIQKETKYLGVPDWVVEATNKVENSVGLFDLVQYKKPRLFGENKCASLLILLKRNRKQSLPFELLIVQQQRG